MEAPAARAHRRGGRAGGEQLRGGRAAGRGRAGRRARGGGLARAAGGDRRLVPGAGRGGAVGRARCVEVGTTNRTRRADYEPRLGPDTGAILRVHQSNFRTVGFVEEAGIEELCPLGVPVIDDVGSGALAERGARAGGRARACGARWRRARPWPASPGDKLLGGPQAGMMVGHAGGDRALPRAPAGAGAADRQALAGGARGASAAHRDRRARALARCRCWPCSPRRRRS